MYDCIWKQCFVSHVFIKAVFTLFCFHRFYVGLEIVCIFDNCYGFFQCFIQFIVPFCNSLRLSLFSRRSRHHAGPRFQKRGMDLMGHVANEVETEQLLQIQTSWYLIIL